MKPVKIKIRNLHFSYADHKVLNNIHADIEANTITAVSGPSGQGKSTLLMTLNRLWETTPGASFKGDIQIQFNDNFQNIYDPQIDLHELRRKVAMVFQVPNPLPMSIKKNIAFPLKLLGNFPKAQVDERVETALKQAFLYDEVKDRLDRDARLLSGGQQQRLCIARALVLHPQIFLLDEPTSSLDETSGAIIEDLIFKLKKECTILLVSHSTQQIKRLADQCLHLENGILAPQINGQNQENIGLRYRNFLLVKKSMKSDCNR